jgi:hypothetical protein
MQQQVGFYVNILAVKIWLKLIMLKLKQQIHKHLGLGEMLWITTGQKIKLMKVQLQLQQNNVKLGMKNIFFK